MRLRTGFGAVATAWLLLSPSPTAGKTDKPLCTAITAAAVEGARGRSNTFSAAATTDLTFQVLLDASLSGDHTLELKLLTPRGFLYRSIVTPISIGVTVGKTGAHRAVDGYPAPQAVRKATPVTVAGRQAHQVEVPFPVGGTDIQSSSIYGQWQVRAYLDGAEAPCGAELKFRIVE
jgi:hypothetical protein